MNTTINQQQETVNRMQIENIALSQQINQIDQINQANQQKPSSEKVDAAIQVNDLYIPLDLSTIHVDQSVQSVQSVTNQDMGQQTDLHKRHAHAQQQTQVRKQSIQNNLHATSPQHESTLIPQQYTLFVIHNQQKMKEAGHQHKYLLDYLLIH